VSSCRSHSRAKDLALVQERFIWHVPYLERIQGVLDGLWDPQDPIELAALSDAFAASTAARARGASSSFVSLRV
jgi:hypothetical protein